MLARVGMSSVKFKFCFSLLNAYICYTMSEKKKNPHAVALSRLGARKGGEARAAALSAERRREIAQKAARARWAKTKKKTNPPS
jgi:hypothetical protein